MFCKFDLFLARQPSLFIVYLSSVFFLLFFFHLSHNIENSSIYIQVNPIDFTFSLRRLSLCIRMVYIALLTKSIRLSHVILIFYKRFVNLNKSWCEMKHTVPSKCDCTLDDWIKSVFELVLIEWLFDLCVCVCIVYAEKKLLHIRWKCWLFLLSIRNIVSPS